MNDELTPLLQNAVLGYRSPKSNGRNGSSGLAPIMGLSNSILSRKVNPVDDGAHCSPEQVVTICNETGDLAVMHAMAARVGCLLMPIAPAAAGDLAPDLAANFKELGEWLQVATAANAASTISDNSLAELSKEMIEALSATIATFQRLKAKHAAGKPAHLRAAA